MIGRLTLTAASRVYLLEPQWNPSLEEQALARIYRIGQKQDVITIRFLMKDSIEKVIEPPRRNCALKHLTHSFSDIVRDRYPRQEEGISLVFYCRRGLKFPAEGCRNYGIGSNEEYHQFRDLLYQTIFLLI
jgi:hypothetical protein